MEDSGELIVTTPFEKTLGTLSGRLNDIYGDVYSQIINYQLPLNPEDYHINPDTDPALYQERIIEPLTGFLQSGERVDPDYMKQVYTRDLVVLREKYQKSGQNVGSGVAESKTYEETKAVLDQVISAAERGLFLPLPLGSPENESKPEEEISVSLGSWISEQGLKLSVPDLDDEIPSELKDATQQLYRRYWIYEEFSNLRTMRDLEGSLMKYMNTKADSLFDKASPLEQQLRFISSGALSALNELKVSPDELNFTPESCNLPLWKSDNPAVRLIDIWYVSQVVERNLEKFNLNSINTWVRWADNKFSSSEFRLFNLLFETDAAPFQSKKLLNAFASRLVQSLEDPKKSANALGFINKNFPEFNRLDPRLATRFNKLCDFARTNLEVRKAVRKAIRANNRIGYEQVFSKFIRSGWSFSGI